MLYFCARNCQAVRLALYVVSVIIRVSRALKAYLCVFQQTCVADIHLYHDSISWQLWNSAVNLNLFIDAFAKLWKATLASSWLSVRPSAWSNSSTTGQIFMKCWMFFENLSR